MPVTALGISSSVLPDGDLGGHAGDRVAGRLGGQGGRAADARVDLDDIVRSAESGSSAILDVAAALDAQRADDLEGRRRAASGTPCRSASGWGDDDAVAGVDAHRVEVLHVADGDAVVGAVAHHLVLDLFPAGEDLLDQDLVDGAGGEAAADDRARTPPCVGRCRRRCRPGCRRGG